MKKTLILAACCLAATFAYASPIPSGKLKLITQVNPSADLSLQPGSMFNPRYADGDIYANQIGAIGVACFGRYPSGGGTATLARQSNLGALVFAPIGNMDFQDVDGSVATVYGPNGVTLRTQNSAVRLLLTPSGVTIIVPGGQVAVTPSGVAVTNLTVTVTGGDVVADGISLKTHRHGGVQVGGGNTGVPIA